MQEGQSQRVYFGISHSTALTRNDLPVNTPSPLEDELTNAVAGLQIALVHLLFNFSGLFLIYPLRSIRKLPLDAARLVTRVAVRSRKLTVLWVLLLFYGLPGLCIAIFQWFR